MLLTPAIFAGSVRRLLNVRKYRFERIEHPGTRQLLVDVSAIVRGDVRTGIQRVVRAVLGYLIAAKPVGVIVQPVFATRNHGYCKAAFTPEGRVINAASSDGALQPVEVAKGDIFFGLDLAAHTLPPLEGHLRQWKRVGITINFMVYDLLPLSRPEWFSSRLAANFRRWIGVLARQADRCICISEATSQDLQRHLKAFSGARRPEIVTVPLGADLDASFPSRGIPEDHAHLTDWLRGRRAVLAVGTVEPRKGHDKLLAAFDHLWQDEPGSDLSLVIVGRAGWKTDRLQEKIRTHQELGKRLVWVEQASDDVLAELYRECTGLVSASLAEGFGLPLIEALRHGLPVLARNIPVFREVGGDLFNYFDDDAPAAFAASIRHWLNNRRIPTAEVISTLPRWEISGAMILDHLGLEPELRTACR